VPAVLRIDVLDRLLAPLVLEIDVDVGRLVALARNESLEQQRHARGIHLGDAEAEAHGRVRGRTAALAEDAARARELDDVVDGEEISLITQLGDQREFVRDRLLDVRGRALRPAAALALHGELAEPARGRLAFRHDLARILVAEFVERERAARGDVERHRHEFRRVDRGETLERAQVALAVREQRVARAVHGGAEPGGGEHVLQRAPAAHVHVHVASGHERQSESLAESLEPLEPAAVLSRSEQFHSDPEAPGEHGGEPVAMRFVRRLFRHPESQEI